MSAHIRLSSRQNLRILSSILHSSGPEIRTAQTLHHVASFINASEPGACLQVPNDGQPRVARRKVKDLEQGSLTGPPLPQLEPEDAPQYPTVIQGARNNMIKFDKCLILTRVGNFYEVRYSRYVPLKRC